MTIEFTSIIVGAVLWELVRSYALRKLIPDIKNMLDKVSNKMTG